MTLNQYLIVSTLIFGIGIFTVIARKNLLGILIGLQLMLGSVALNFVAFGRFSNEMGIFSSQSLALFVIALSVAELVLGLAMVIVLARRFNSVDPETPESLKG